MKLRLSFCNNGHLRIEPVCSSDRYYSAGSKYSVGINDGGTTTMTIVLSHNFNNLFLCRIRKCIFKNISVRNMVGG